MLTQLQTPLPLQTPKGKAWAVAIIDYGPHWDLLWVTFIHDTRRMLTFGNKDIRQEENMTFGIRAPSFGPHYQGNGHTANGHGLESFTFKPPHPEIMDRRQVETYSQSPLIGYKNRGRKPDFSSRSERQKAQAFR